MLLNTGGTLLHPGPRRAACAQKPDPNSRFRDALLACNLLGRNSAHLLFKKNAVARPADFENSRDIYGRQIYSGFGAKLGQGLVTRLTPQYAAIYVECDGIYPGDDEAFIS